ncbi:hypothetical protein MTBUT4_440027 [Magnetospirillum sp. UT-4]|nr:hypothetical protein MTBUT4_440027 [Magnetospirillum sp. UT-4]
MRGRPGEVKPVWASLSVSIHAPVRGRQVLRIPYVAMLLFQSTPP